MSTRESIAIADLVVEAISNTLKPEQVFDTEQLEDWTEKNGYVKAE